MKKLILLLLSLQCSLINYSLAQQPGDLDNSFSNDGMITSPNAPWYDIAVQPDGKLLAVGNMLARFNVDGTLDGSFGINGIDTIKVNDTVYTCSAVGIQQDGKILVAGTPNGGSTNLLLIRYNIDGSLDSSFDSDGIVWTDIDGGSVDFGYKLAIQADGKIIVSGSANSALAVCRYLPNGSLDVTFGSYGRSVLYGVNVITNNYWHEPGYMKLQADGKILVGTVERLMRLNIDGSIDNSFGTNGNVPLSYGMNDVAIQPDGKILLAGSNTSSVLLMRLGSDGVYDNSFGNSGIAVGLNWPGSPRQTATSVTLQSDGRILTGGFRKYGVLSDGRDFLLRRFHQNGIVDSSFGTNGQVVTVFTQGDAASEGHATAITPDLKVVLCGYYTTMPDQGYLARYHLGDMLEVNNFLSTNEHFTISPNPTFDWVNIESSSIENGLWHLEVRDITGRLLQQEDITVTGEAIKKKISLKDQPEGVYLLQLDNGKERTVSRVVKNK